MDFGKQGGVAIQRWKNFTILLSLGLPKGNRMSIPQTVIEFKEAIGKKITSIGSEVTKTVIDSMKKRAHDCIQPEGRHFKNCCF